MMFPWMVNMQSHFAGLGDSLIFVQPSSINMNYCPGRYRKNFIIPLRDRKTNAKLDKSCFSPLFFFSPL